MNMEQYKESLRELNEIDSNWMKILLNNSTEWENSSEKLKEAINKFLIMLKEDAKKDKNIRSKIKKLFDDKQFLAWIEKWLSNATAGYYGFEPVRALQSKGLEMVKNLLRVAFENGILRTDMDLNSKLAAYQLKEKEIPPFMSVYLTLTMYYITQHISKGSIKIDFMQETGLSEEVCDYYADLVDENYLMLSMNYIMDKVGYGKNNSI